MAPFENSTACTVTVCGSSKPGTAHHVIVVASGALSKKTRPPADGSRSAKNGAIRGAPEARRSSPRVGRRVVGLLERQVAVGVDEQRREAAAVELERERDRLRDRIVVAEGQRAAERGAKLGARGGDGVSGAGRFEAQPGVCEVEWIGAEDQVAAVFEDRDVVLVAIGCGPRDHRGGATTVPEPRSRRRELQQIANVARVRAEAAVLRRAAGRRAHGHRALGGQGGDAGVGRLRQRCRRRHGRTHGDRNHGERDDEQPSQKHQLIHLIVRGCGRRQRAREAREQTTPSSALHRYSAVVGICAVSSHKLRSDVAPAAFDRHTRSQLPLPRGTLAGLLIAILAVGTVALFSYRSLQSRSDAANLITHTKDVIQQLESIGSINNAAESAQRGYLLTSEARFFEQYNRASTLAPAQADRLGALVSDNPEQAARAAAMRGFITTRLQVASSTIELQQAGDHAGAMALLRAGRGIAAMDAIRDLIVEMTAAEQQLLQQREATWLAAARLSLWVTFGGSAILIRPHRDRRRPHVARLPRPAGRGLDADRTDVAHRASAGRTAPRPPWRPRRAFPGRLSWRAGWRRLCRRRCRLIPAHWRICLARVRRGARPRRRWSGRTGGKEQSGAPCHDGA